MNTDRLYEIFLTIVIIGKLFYLFSTIRMKTLERLNTNDEKLKKIKDRNERILIGSEILMYILLLIIFRPWQSHKNVVINRHEQVIFFILGILGLIHSDWSLLLFDK